MSDAAARADAAWMRLAIAQAEAAAAHGEVPVGAVLVGADGQLLATGRNAPIAQHDPTAHAEILALRAGAAARGNYRLDGCTLYVTLEPCAMCAGAMLHARLARVVYGAPDGKTGAAGSVLHLFAEPQLNHRTQVAGGVLAHECGAVLQAFFGQRRADAARQAEPLREDALRTPDAAFAGLPPAGHYLHSAPALAGLRLHVQHAAGAQPPFLLLHPSWGWSHTLQPAIDALQAATGREVLAPDAPGCGRSDKPKKPAGYSLAQMAAALAAAGQGLRGAWLVAVGDAAALAPAALAALPGGAVAALLYIDLPAEPVDPVPYPDRGHRALHAAFPRGFAAAAADIPGVPTHRFALPGRIGDRAAWDTLAARLASLEHLIP